VLSAVNAAVGLMNHEHRVAYSFRRYFATKLVELGLSVAQIRRMALARHRPWSSGTTIAT